LERFQSVTGLQLGQSVEYARASVEDPKSSEKLCRVCGTEANRVLSVTVATHVDARFWPLLADGYRFCAAENCPVLYFDNKKKLYFTRDEVKTRFGPKEKTDPRPVCYCLNILAEQIRAEIEEKKCCYSLQDIVAYTKAGTGKWCLTTNPSGKCCREYLPKIVDAYLQKAGIEPLADQLRTLRQDLEEEGPMQKIVLAVRGMTCESCASSVKATLENVGAKGVKVSFKDGRAELIAPTKTRANEISKVVDEMGYGASVVETERLE
jgi:copper chaperone CopZ